MAWLNHASASRIADRGTASRSGRARVAWSRPTRWRRRDSPSLAVHLAPLPGSVVVWVRARSRFRLLGGILTQCGPRPRNAPAQGAAKVSSHVWRTPPGVRKVPLAHPALLVHRHRGRQKSPRMCGVRLQACERSLSRIRLCWCTGTGGGKSLLAPAGAADRSGSVRRPPSPRLFLRWRIGSAGRHKSPHSPSARIWSTS